VLAQRKFRWHLTASWVRFVADSTCVQVRGSEFVPVACTGINRCVARSAVTLRSQPRERLMAWTRVRVTSDGQRRQHRLLPRPRRRHPLRWHLLQRTRRATSRAASEGKVEDGSWYDRHAGRVTFRAYVEESWWPSRHLERLCERQWMTAVDLRGSESAVHEMP